VKNNRMLIGTDVARCIKMSKECLKNDEHRLNDDTEYQQGSTSDWEGAIAI